jgi:hypothetical protein
VYRRALACACGECNVDRLAGVGLYAPLDEPGMKGVKVLLEVQGSCSGVIRILMYKGFQGLRNINYISEK